MKKNNGFCGLNIWGSVLGKKRTFFCGFPLFSGQYGSVHCTYMYITLDKKVVFKNKLDEANMLILFQKKHLTRNILSSQGQGLYICVVPMGGLASLGGTGQDDISVQFATPDFRPCWIYPGKVDHIFHLLHINYPFFFWPCGLVSRIFSFKVKSRRFSVFQIKIVCVGFHNA